MSRKEPGKNAVITSAVNVQVDIEIVDTFAEVIFQDDSASCNRAWSVQIFPQERYQLKVMTGK